MKAVSKIDFQAFVQHPELAFSVFKQAVEALGTFEALKDAYEEHKAAVAVEIAQLKLEANRAMAELAEERKLNTQLKLQLSQLQDRAVAPDRERL